MNGKSLWYDFGLKKGGGAIELVQQFYGANCFEAGRLILENHWIIENRGSAFLETEPPLPEEKDPALAHNPPIRQNLLPQLTEQSTHPAF